MNQIARRAAAAAAAVACLAGCAAHPAAGNRVQVTDSTAPTPTLGALTPTINRTAASTALTLSSARVVYGHERAERLTVTVAPRYPWFGTPGGKVTIKAVKTTVCTITIASGKGSCALTARKLPVGTHTLVAVYRGSPYFTSSISPKKALKVVK